MQEGLQTLAAENSTLKREQKYARIWKSELEELSAQKQHFLAELDRIQTQAEGVCGTFP